MNVNGNGQAVIARLEIENLSIRLGNRLVLKDVTFDVPHGAQIAIVGPNGAGKTTLFKILAGLLSPDNGTVSVHGRAVDQHHDCVAYIPQKDEVDWRFPITVQEVVMMGRFGRMKGFRKPGKYDWNVVHNSLRQIGMDALAKEPIRSLSGGQQQRVFIARAIAQEPHILLMDEPFSGVDYPSQEATLEFLAQVRKQEVTVLISTHDLEMAGKHFDRVLLLNQQVVAYGEPPGVFSPNALNETFKGHVLFVNGTAVVDQCCPPSDSHQYLE